MQIKVSRDARKTLNALSEISGKDFSIDDIFASEELCYSYYSKTVIGHIKRFYNPDSKGNPNSILFYTQPTKSINKGRRNKDSWDMSDHDRRIYWAIGSYLIEDYNYDNLCIIKSMCQYEFDDISEAIKIAKSEDVFSIPYVLRIVEGIVARREERKRQIQNRRGLFNKPRESDANKRSRIDIANLMDRWGQTIENVELQNRVDRLYRRGNE